MGGITIDRKGELGFCFIILEVLRLEPMHPSQSLNSRSCCLCLLSARIAPELVSFIQLGKTKQKMPAVLFLASWICFSEAFDLLERNLLLCPIWVPFSYIHFAIFIETVSLHKMV